MKTYKKQKHSSSKNNNFIITFYTICSLLKQPFEYWYHNKRTLL